MPEKFYFRGEAAIVSGKSAIVARERFFFLSPDTIAALPLTIAASLRKKPSGAQDNKRRGAYLIFRFSSTKLLQSISYSLQA